MSVPGTSPDRNSRGPFAAAVIAVVAVLVALGVLYVNRANGGDRPAAVVTPTPSVAATPAVSASAGATPSSSAASTPSASGATTQVAYADCSKVAFGSALQPVNPPSDVHTYPAAPAMTIDTTKLYRATIHTASGDIVICLQPELAPKTVNNFVTLARNHFFDGLTFHRVVADFVVQGGDPTGSGNGGPGYKFNDEPVRQQYVLGAVAMANSGANTNGSQFFIDIADDSAKLQPLYNLFGKVESGQNVANGIKQGDTMITVTVAQQQ